MSKKKTALLYHAGCPDGFGARFAFETKHGDDFEYIPVEHKNSKFKGVERSFLKGRRVFMVDTSFVRKDAIEASEICKEFKIIDHHLSAMKDLDGLEFAHFDMDHSGAVLAWMECYPEKTVPKLLQYIEDRDLWRFNLPYTEELLTAVDSYERTFEAWSELDKRIDDPSEFSKLLQEGTAILRYNKVLRSKIKEHAYYTEVKGYEVPVVNSPFFRPEILSELARGEHFSAGYHFDGEQFVFSLRSTDEGVDVSKIASQFPGGGGHRNASGFSVKTLDELK